MYEKDAGREAGRKMNARTIISAVVVVAGCLVAHAVAVPRPSLVPKSWQLQFDFVDPQTITVQLPGEKAPQTFWYMLYTVINKSEREVQFLPRFELMTNRMQVMPGDPGVHPMVFEAVKRRHRGTHPLLVEPVKVMGRLLRGPDNAKHSVAIWPQIDIRANRFAVYVAGLSGESVLVKNPSYKRGEPEYVVKKLKSGTEMRIPVNPRYFTLRKTLAIEYVLPGDKKTRATARVGRLSKKWIMR